MRSITESNGFMSCAESSTVMWCSRERRRSSATIPATLRMSRLASGSSSSSRRGRRISACAISTRCCWPPDRLPIRWSANGGRLHRLQHLIDLAPTRPRGQRNAQTRAIEAERRRGRAPASAYRDRARISAARSRPRRALPPPSKATLAAARRDEAEDGAQQRRLARPVRADQAAELARRPARSRCHSGSGGRRARRSPGGPREPRSSPACAQCPFCSVSVDTLSATAFRSAATSASIQDW